MSVYRNNPDRNHEEPRPDAVSLQGHVKGDTTSMVALTLGPAGSWGTMQYDRLRGTQSN